MKKFIGILAGILLMAGVTPLAWANNELHPGGRLFFPLWDVSTPSRLTFIVITREAMREGASITAVKSQWRISGNPGKCLPRGVNGSSTNVNRGGDPALGALGGTVFVDDVHFEYYGRTCIRADEIVHMSCGDTDLFVLAAPNNETIQPRLAFQAVADQGRGALDVHMITNSLNDPRLRKAENSLMGSAIITDLSEGWAAQYAAAAAKAVACTDCDNIDGGTAVGYENYPMEVYLPVAFADGFPTQGGDLRNVLSLWGPGLFPGANLIGTSFHVDYKWWDGRERSFIGDIVAHALIRPLGGAAIGGLPPVDSLRFSTSNFVCGDAGTSGNAENDGFPRLETEPGFCGAPSVADPSHKSDNFESVGDTNVLGHRIQPSTPIGWWRFTMRRDGQVPFGLTGDHSGRGLVGVVLSSAPGTGGEPNSSSSGVGFATRLWHEDSCEVAQSGLTIGPPHKGHDNISNNSVALFNTLTNFSQKVRCHLIPLFAPFPGNIILPPTD